MSPAPRRQQLHLIYQTIIPNLLHPRPIFPLPNLLTSRRKMPLYPSANPPISDIIRNCNQRTDNLFEEHLSDGILSFKRGAGVGHADEGVEESLVVGREVTVHVGVDQTGFRAFEVAVL